MYSQPHNKMNMVLHNAMKIMHKEYWLPRASYKCYLKFDSGDIDTVWVTDEAIEDLGLLNAVNQQLAHKK